MALIAEWRNTSWSNNYHTEYIITKGNTRSENKNKFYGSLEWRSHYRLRSHEELPKEATLKAEGGAEMDKSGNLGSEHAVQGVGGRRYHGRNQEKASVEGGSIRGEKHGSRQQWGCPLFYCFLFAVLGLEPRTSHMPGMCFTTELYPQSLECPMF